ncbi:MAG TPA: L,D-transpeptidase [Thermoanaerobaculia bacterium]|nr:L,D-transpeptidase [Thermoanaerobaculia bacterium]
MIPAAAPMAVMARPPLENEAKPAAQPTGLDVQVQLDRTGFSPGVIDGKPGSNTKKALAAFQEAHDLPVTGNLDPATWQSLAAAGAGPTLGEYTITQEDADGPFTPQIPEDMLEKAKLPGLYYTSILEALGERFHATPEFLKQLNPQARFAAGERIKVPNVRSGPIAAESGEVEVVVSKSNGALTVDRGGDVLFFAPVTSGSEHDPLPIGDWKVNGVSKNPTFNYNPDLFWDADPGHTKAKIPAGPNNPVGVVWIDISKEHYGLHGTPEPRTIGRSESHGCVRLTNWDALTLASLVKPGTPVLFRP